MRVDWAQFKAFVDGRTVPIHEKELDDNNLLLEAHDGPIVRNCKLKDGTSDMTDYVTNYQSSANASMTDSNGIMLARTKITKTGWHFQLHGIEFSTSKLNSLFNEDSDGNDLGFTSIKFYNSANTELVAGTQVELDNNCVKTVVDWEMDNDIEIIGGTLEQVTPPNSDVRVWIIAIPDLTIAQGGSIPFVQGGLNLKYISTKVDIDGKTPKLLPYNSVSHTNKFRMIIKHGSGVQCPINLLFKLFRKNS